MSPPSSPQPPLIRSRAVWLSAAAGALLVLLVGTSAQRLAQAASRLDEGTGDLLFKSVSDRILLQSHMPTPADLDTIVVEHRDLGLLSLSVRRHSEQVSSNGHPAAGDLRKLTRPFPPPPHPRHQHRPGERRPRARPEEDQPRLFWAPPRGRSRVGGPPSVTMFFETRAAQQAEREVLWQWTMASLAALAMVGLGLRFAQSDRRRDRLQRALNEQQLLASLGEMSAVLAHEIRNPLGSLKGHAQLLVEDLNDQAVSADRAERLVNDATRLESTVNELLAFIRSGELHHADVDVAVVMNDAIGRVPEAVATIETTLAPKQTAWVDAGRLGLAIENVLRNGAAAGSGQILVRLALHKGRLRITIEDDGPGVLDEDREAIFKPFFTTKAKGTGLGLALASRIAQAHGGHLLLVTPERLNGAAFVFDLPLRHQGDS